MLNNIIKDTEGFYRPSKDYKLYSTRGGCSNIYKGNDILKIYHRYIPEYLRITEDIFKTLKDIDDENFIKLKDYYIDNHIVAYTSEYIDCEDKFNILNKNKELVMYNLRRLEKLILLFTKLNIYIDDVNYKNYILNKDNLVLIDPDSYRFVDEDAEIRGITKDNLLGYNYKKLLESFIDLYVKCFYRVSSRYNLGSVEFNKIIFDVFKYDKNDDDPVNTACKRLENLRMDCFKKNK